MTNKEYLQQIKKMDEAINEELDYIERLRSTLGMSGIRYDKDKIQTSHEPDVFGEVFAKITEEEDKLNRMIDTFIDTKSKVLESIHAVDNDTYRKILYHHYIDYKTLKDVSVIVNYSYKYVKDMHLEALQTIVPLFPTL